MPQSKRKLSVSISPPVFIGVLVVVLVIVAVIGIKAVSDPVQRPVFTPAPFGGPGTKDPLLANRLFPPGMTPKGMIEPTGAPAARPHANPYGGVSTFTGR